MRAAANSRQKLRPIMDPAIDPVAREDTIHAMANSLRRLEDTYVHGDAPRMHHPAGAVVVRTVFFNPPPTSNPSPGGSRSSPSQPRHQHHVHEDHDNQYQHQQHQQYLEYQQYRREHLQLQDQRRRLPNHPLAGYSTPLPGSVISHQTSDQGTEITTYYLSSSPSSSRTTSSRASSSTTPPNEPLCHRPSTRASMEHPGRRTSLSSSHHTRSSSSTTTSGASYIGAASPYPAPVKPLPPVPRPRQTPGPGSAVTSPALTNPSSMSPPLRYNEFSHQPHTDKSSIDTGRFSQASSNASHPSFSSTQSQRMRPPVPPRPPEHLRPGDYMQPRRKQEPQHDQYQPQQQHQFITPRPVEVMFWKQLTGAEKHKMGKSNAIHHIDIATSASVIATKHGNRIVKFWSVQTGIVVKTIKISAYIEAHSRSRDFMVRSHIVLSESMQLAAIATRFGRTIEIWNWGRAKRLQTIDNADRWVAGRFESYDSGWSPLVAYRGKDALIDLFAVTNREKEPYAKVRTIDLNKAGLPFIPQYPELALSQNNNMLVAAAGPRTPRAGQPPPDRETILVAWDISDYREATSQPSRQIRPWQHRELETAVPCNLAVHGDLIVSLWIPAGHRTVTKPTQSGGSDYSLAPAPVPFRYVLIWDLSENSTRTYGIPNATCCVSPDCRFVAYCNSEVNGINKLAILDATSGDEVWSIGGEGNLSSMQALPSLGDLSNVTELSFSADGRFLVVGDMGGNSSMYDVKEVVR